MTLQQRWAGRFRRPVFLWAFAALVADLVAARILARGSALTSSAHTALVLAPLLPLLIFVVALVRMVQHMDELQQRVCLESVFIAFVGSLTLVFVFTGLEQAGVWRPRWDAIGTAMMVLWAGGYVYASWKYR